MTLDEEIEFAKNYFELIQHKYQDYYHLKIDSNNNYNTSAIYVPPFCLQLLVENAIQHNLGSKETPVIISISTKNMITVINTNIPKKYNKSTGGRALKNLSTQFSLLCGTGINVEHTNTHFKVVLPFINSNSDV